MDPQTAPRLLALPPVEETLKIQELTSAFRFRESGTHEYARDRFYKCLHNRPPTMLLMVVLNNTCHSNDRGLGVCDVDACCGKIPHSRLRM